MKKDSGRLRFARLSPALPTSLLKDYSLRLGGKTAENLWFVFAAIVYFTVAWWLAVDVQYYFGDALSRTQNALSVLYSRNPNLSAMGYVFTPLTTVAQLPFVAFAPLFPEVARTGLAGAIVSILFMAGAVREFWMIASERGAPGRLAIIATLLFALNPMIVLYGSVGMSEAPFIFGTLWATRRLIRWTSTDDVHDLIKSGFALVITFLARYDGLVMAFVAALVVGFMAWSARRRRKFGDVAAFASLDMLVLVWPIGITFLTWTVASWLTTGDLLAQFSSVYGNSSLIAQAGGTSGGLSLLSDAIIRTFLVSPALPLLILVASWFAFRRHDLEPVFPMVLMLTVLGFQIFSHATGSTFGMMRFFIMAIPLTLVLYIQIVSPGDRFPSLRPGATFRERSIAKNPPAWFLELMFLVVLASTVFTGFAMKSQQWAPQEFAIQQAIPGLDRGSLEDQSARIRVLKDFSTEKDVADYLDNLNLGEGEVLVSAARAFAVITASENQKQFAIQSDLDYVERINDPSGYGVRYILAAEVDDGALIDPIALRYPELYDTGSRIATLEMEFPNKGDTQPNWRLYRVLNTPETP
ncbi:glycosyltransferase family 39 protein [Corynebacterium callunae]|uniref:ArnT family glycosyltransferase n=1 Tax=Corynebacterium callunae TaxID=1721 RepID=UPI003982B1E3